MGRLAQAWIKQGRYIPTGGQALRDQNLVWVRQGSVVRENVTKAKQ